MKSKQPEWYIEEDIIIETYNSHNKEITIKKIKPIKLLKKFYIRVNNKNKFSFQKYFEHKYKIKIFNSKINECLRLYLNGILNVEKWLNARREELVFVTKLDKDLQNLIETKGANKTLLKSFNKNEKNKLIKRYKKFLTLKNKKQNLELKIEEIASKHDMPERQSQKGRKHEKSLGRFIFELTKIIKAKDKKGKMQIQWFDIINLFLYLKIYYPKTAFKELGVINKDVLKSRYQKYKTTIKTNN